MYPPQDAKTRGCHIAMCVSILSAFGVSAQFAPFKFSLDPSVHATEGNVAMNTKTSATVGTRFFSNNYIITMCQTDFKFI